MTTAVSPALRPTASEKARNIVAVASGKGGIGKTWLAVTLAHALARLGRRALLFDGDLGLANVDIQLGLMPEHDLGGVLSGRLSLAQATLPFAPGGFDTARDGERTYAALLRACESFLDLSPPLLGVVRRDPKVREAIRSQTGLLTRFPNCTAAADVEALAAKLTSVSF